MEIEEQMEILRISTCESLTQRELEDIYLKKNMKGIIITVSLDRRLKEDPYLFYLIQKRIDEVFYLTPTEKVPPPDSTTR